VAEQNRNYLMLDFPKPHGDKLKALLENNRLPNQDRARVSHAIERYENWLHNLKSVRGSYNEIIAQMVSYLNDYKTYLEVDLIFDSENSFLYRQKGQLKLDNTVIEEFLPIFATAALFEPLQSYELLFGPTTCFSNIRFESSITGSKPGGGIQLREKDHDFAISRRLFIRTSHELNFQESVTVQTHVAYVAAECKTNLDKTMFQEAAATALDVKTTVPGAKYYLLCEWLDMTPISTATTAIDEVIILRKARRLSSDIRSQFSTTEGRRENKDLFANYLHDHPFSVEAFTRFLDHIRKLIDKSAEDDVLNRGYF
jgi:hypothetical protein